jgi:hypothetical protein
MQDPEQESLVSAADSGQLGRELAELLAAKLAVLRSLDFPGVWVIEPKLAVASGWWMRRRSVLAWLACHERHPCRDTWLGIDGRAYVDESRGFRGGWSVASLADLDIQTLEGAILSLKRLLRFHAPEHALPERIRVFGTVLTAVPRAATPWEHPPERLHQQWQEQLDDSAARECESDPRYPAFYFLQTRMVPVLDYHIKLPPAFSQAREEEERREAADDEADSAVPCHDGPVPGRDEQVRYLFVSWLHRTTTQSWRPPEEFFRAPDRYGRPTEPNVPFAPGGPVQPAEIAVLIGPLVNDGLAEWVDDYSASSIDEYRPKLLLTASGLRYAASLESRFATTRRVRGLRTALLTWAGRHAKPPYLVPLEDFVTSPASIVNGITVTLTDVQRTARWLLRRGYLHCPDHHSTGIGLTSKGLQCLEHYQGDPHAMGGAQHRGDDLRTFTFHGPAGNVAIDSEQVTQQFGSGAERAEADDAALRRFAEAVAQALPVLGLGDARQAAEALTAEIAQASAESHPDHAKLRALGRSLRAVLEGAAGDALAPGLLNLWKG